MNNTLQRQRQLAGILSESLNLTEDRFSDSSDATAFMERIGAMLRDPKLVDWVNSTSDHYDSNAGELFSQAVQAYNQFLQAMYDAE